MHRFYAPAITPRDRRALLPADEAEHLTRVLRLGVGAAVIVFDGRGRAWNALVVSALRRQVEVELRAPLPTIEHDSLAITLCQAVLKGDKMDDIVRDAVMLGVGAIQPIVTRRTEASLAVLLRAHRAERWQRVALASTKQSGRAVLPAVHPPMTFEKAVEPAADGARDLLLVEPSLTASSSPEPSSHRLVAHGARELRSLLGTPAPRAVRLWVGPEGGWDADEQLMAQRAGLVPVSLGPRTLRADAVATVALSMLQVIWP